MKETNNYIAIHLENIPNFNTNSVVVKATISLQPRNKWTQNKKKNNAWKNDLKTSYYKQ